MRKSLLVLVVVLVLLVGGGATYMLVENKLSATARLRANLRAQAKAQGVNPDFVDAIARVESGYNPEARNLTGPDGLRGGSYGPTQISQKTARAYGFQGDMNELCAPDGMTAGYWTARILAARPGGAGPFVDVEDIAAWWNAGKYDQDRVAAGSTEWDYRAKLLDATVAIHSDPPPELSAAGPELA